MRALAEQSPTKRATAERLNTDTPYHRLLTKPSTIQVDLTEHPNWESEARKNGLIRFLGNPHARWGPMGKAVAKKKRPNEDSDAGDKKKTVRLLLRFRFFKNQLCENLVFFRIQPIQVHRPHQKKMCDHFFSFVFCVFVKAVHNSSDLLNKTR